MWALPAAPAEDVRAKADRLTGGSAAHRAWPDIAWSATPWSKDDQARLDAVTKAATEARARWDAFDVELTLARQLDGALAPVEVIRDDADRARLVDALLLQGSAVVRAVPEAAFPVAESVADWRRPLGDLLAPAPLLDVVAMEPDRAWTRADVPDALTLRWILDLQRRQRAATAATLSVEVLPVGASLVVDGRTVAGTRVSLPAGHHHVHVLAGGVVHGRRELDLAPGSDTVLDPFVSRAELDDAATRVAAGSRDVPDDVGRAAQALARSSTPPARTYLAALDASGKPVLVGYANGASVEVVRPVTVLLTGEVGGGVVISPGFDGHLGETDYTAPAFGGALGVELGIYNALILAQVDLALTPTEQMKFANAAETENIPTNAYVRPRGGLGVYLLRPRKGIPTLQLAGTYGWMSPGALGPGAALSFGVPLRGEGSWLRFTLDGFRGVQMEGFPGEGSPTWFGALRVGFAGQP